MGGRREADEVGLAQGFAHCVGPEEVEGAASLNGFAATKRMMFDAEDALRLFVGMGVSGAAALVGVREEFAAGCD